MLRSFFILFIVFSLSFTLSANKFYIDPINGKIDNDGSFGSPWSTLEDVISNNLIKSYSNTLPYNPNTNKLIIKNENAPINSGDTLVLLKGLHGDVNLINYINLEKIYIIAYKDHNPILKKLKVTACKNWVFKGLSISSEPYGEYINEKLVFLESHNWQGPTSKIDIINCKIYSTLEPWEKAINWVNYVSDGIVANCDSINILNNLLTNIDMGISASGDFANIINNDIINFSGDGIRVLGSNILVESNLIKNCYDVDENHDDGIQSFTTNENVVDNNIIRSNIILNYDNANQKLLGNLQGIGCFDGFYHNWIIENNLIVVNHWHGITFLGADNCLIINNTVINPSPDIKPEKSWIMIDDHKDGTPSKNCIIKNNVSNSLIVNGENSNNVQLKTYQEYKENFINYSKNDFHLTPNSLLINKGDTTFAPKYDIEGNKRIYSPDIGAYEFIIPNKSSELYANEVTIYPNPTRRNININTDFTNYTLRIFNSKGCLMLKTNVHNQSTFINIESFPTGLYYLLINIGNIKVVKTIIKTDF